MSKLSEVPASPNSASASTSSTAQGLLTIAKSADGQVPHTMEAAIAAIGDLQAQLLEMGHRQNELERENHALRTNRDFYRSIVDSLSEHLAILDQQGVILAVNEAWKQFSRCNGGTEQTLDPVGVNYLEACGRDGEDSYSQDALDLHAGMRDVLAGQRSEFHLEYPCHAPDEQRWFRASVTPLKNVHGGLVISHLNITERKKAEMALRERERELLLVANNVPGPVSRVDQDLRYLFANEYYEIYFGKTSEQILGKCMPDVIGHELWQRVEGPVRRALAGEAVTFESHIALPSGEFRHTLVNLVPDFDDQAVARGFFIVAIDISEKKRVEAARASLESQLRESQKMEAIGTLAGGIAHDFNNMLAVILGNTELAISQSRQGPTDTLLFLEEIAKAAEKARSLVQQILSFSRRQPTEHKVAHLGTIVDDTAKLLRSTMPARINLTYSCDNNVPPVLVDRTQIEQVIINLSTNAMQAIRTDSGQIDIRLERVPLDEPLLACHPQLREVQTLQPDQSAVRLVVSDTGTGIEASTLPRIFEPFFTTKAVGEGTGLGLAVVHGIVQSHGGAIVVESELGSGTTFGIYLPACQQSLHSEAHSSGRSVANHQVAAGTRILVIDDDPAVLQSITHLLKMLGYSVTGFTDQQAALAALSLDAKRFDLVVTDYNMPGMSGLEMARKVRMLRTDLPVAITSGFIDEELCSLSSAAGVRELIAKPFVLRSFASTIQRLTQAGKVDDA